MGMVIWSKYVILQHAYTCTQIIHIEYQTTVDTSMQWSRGVIQVQLASMREQDQPLQHCDHHSWAIPSLVASTSIYFRTTNSPHSIAHTAHLSQRTSITGYTMLSSTALTKRLSSTLHTMYVILILSSEYLRWIRYTEGGRHTVNFGIASQEDMHMQRLATTSHPLQMFLYCFCTQTRLAMGVATQHLHVCLHVCWQTCPDRLMVLQKKWSSSRSSMEGEKSKYNLFLI